VTEAGIILLSALSSNVADEAVNAVLCPIEPAAALVPNDCRARDVTVGEWEYLRIDLNQRRPREDELDLLNRAGAEGWELVSINTTNIAYLKRPVEEAAADEMRNGMGATLSRAQPIRPTDNEESNSGNNVSIKYRDPVTGDTWTGRGRMARWLKAKQDAGEDIEKYRV
jgi:hypothetical protein